MRLSLFPLLVNVTASGTVRDVYNYIYIYLFMCIDIVTGACLTWRFITFGDENHFEQFCSYCKFQENLSIIRRWSVWLDMH